MLSLFTSFLAEQISANKYSLNHSISLYILSWPCDLIFEGGVNLKLQFDT
jgi:hypothetical protein